MLETNLESAADDYAKDKGFFVRKVKWVGRRSAPDKLYSRHDTGPFFVEWKRPGKDVEGVQAREAQRMRDAGITVYAVNSWREARALFDR